MLRRTTRQRTGDETRPTDSDKWLATLSEMARYWYFDNNTSARGVASAAVVGAHELEQSVAEPQQQPAAAASTTSGLETSKSDSREWWSAVCTACYGDPCSQHVLYTVLLSVRYLLAYYATGRNIVAVNEHVVQAYDTIRVYTVCAEKVTGDSHDVKLQINETRNSSGDEIANVNFLYDDIVHVLQNTIDSCIPPQIDAAVMCGTHVYQIQWNNVM